MPETVVTSDIGRYAMVPEWLLDLDISPQAIRLYAVLAAKYADRDTGEAYPGRRRLADNLHVSTDTIDRALRELTDCGAVGVETRHDPTGEQETNLYTVRYMRGGGRKDAEGGIGTGAAGGSRKDAAQSRITSDPESVDPVREITRTREPYKLPSGMPDLTPEQRARVVAMHAAFSARIGGYPEPAAGSDLIKRGATETDIDYAIGRTHENAKGRSKWAYFEACVAGRVEERENGDDPDASDRNRGAVRGGGAGGGPRGQRRGSNGNGGGGGFTAPVPIRPSDGPVYPERVGTID